jgi:hypothetical protein
MAERYPARRNSKPMAFGLGCGVRCGVSGALIGVVPGPTFRGDSVAGTPERTTNMGYGIGGILLTILVILAIIYFAKRV